MRLPYVRLVLSALVAAWAASPAFGQVTGTLTSGNATFTLNDTPTAETSISYEADLFADGGVAPDHLFAQWMFYRVASDTRARPFGSYTKSDGGEVSLNGSLSENTMTYSFTEKDSVGATRFTATWTLTLQDGATPGTATVSHSLTIDNPTAADLSLSLIHFLDYDLGGIASGHSADGGFPEMMIARGPDGGTYTPGTTASRYQAAETGTIDLDLINGTATDLTTGGLPFTGDDWTGAYQWELLVPAGESRTILFEMGVSPVPEPGAVFALAAAGLGLIGASRRFKDRAARRKPG